VDFFKFEGHQRKAIQATESSTLGLSLLLIHPGAADYVWSIIETDWHDANP
jgi:hypothetical protein